MVQVMDILKMTGKPASEMEMDLLYQKDQHVPGSIQYNIKRYYAHHPWVAEDTGMMVYHYSTSRSEENYLELRYCTTGNRYCNQKSCSGCAELPTDNCSGKHQTVDVFTFHFTGTFLQQFVHNVKLSNRKDEVLAFKHPHAFTKIFPLCNRKRNALDSLLNHSYSGALENIFVNAKVHELLLYSLECLVDEKEEGFTCKFLADESGRDRIYQAREILLQHIGDPITIKELSRKVAMNECYLKKGFKEVFGTTIFDFYQQQRMEHAKYLLYEKGLSVTDVSALLGYSSISHFSAAFKKHTGIKPCELLK
ncbi:helix-turn-helix domain-containing protein [Sediminibacterium ginsengisoli]|uniref:AraC-type DNA-binding protein n=1 Tax=Sediminibacterium ginsengisoli TaxID=413434 RepID=A0A1T4N9B8_9BACT|nr:AraC family transcriptional regulator [Sediminibacterium ginsengisoli]SJZ75693.1 AraC-type DNA-binding protein [Sediminibacterium ginsengisoli]